MGNARLKEVSASPLTTGNFTEFAYASISEAFPEVDAGLKPFGTFGLFQVKSPKRVSKGGIILTEETVSNDHYNTQVAKVIALGSMCFKTAIRAEDKYGNEVQELVDWPEGPWFNVGDFVRINRHSGDRFTVKFKRTEKQVDPQTGMPENVTVNDQVIFVLMKVGQVFGLVTGDPTKVSAYLD